MPAREIALLANLAAGGGLHERDVAAVVRRLRDAGFAVRRVFARDATEATALAQAEVERGVEALVVCGGDGTVNLAVQALAGTETPLGVVPGGTGNDTARALGIPRHDPVRAADRIVAGRTRRIDLARSGERYFVTVLAAGFDAMVNERANRMARPRGQLRYTLAMLQELRAFTPLHYTLELDGVTRQLDAMLISVGNSDSFGGGLRFTEGADLADGLLDVVLMKPVTKLDLVTTYPKVFRGTHVSHPQYERHRVRRVTVASPGVVAYADGERFGALPLTVEVAPAALSVFV